MTRTMLTPILAAATLLAPALVHAGDLDPPSGAVRPTMNTLDEIYDGIGAVQQSVDALGDLGNGAPMPGVVHPGTFAQGGLVVIHIDGVTQGTVPGHGEGFVPLSMQMGMGAAWTQHNEFAQFRWHNRNRLLTITKQPDAASTHFYKSALAEFGGTMDPALTNMSDMTITVYVSTTPDPVSIAVQMTIPELRVVSIEQFFVQREDASFSPIERVTFWFPGIEEIETNLSGGTFVFNPAFDDPPGDD